MTSYVETSEIGVSILSDGLVKPFSERPAVDDDLIWICDFLSFIYFFIL